MATRLGELLLKQGLVTATELDEALRYQADFGGKLGTNLFEMGILDENELSSILSQQFCLPMVSSDEAMNVDPQVLDLLPKDVVAQHNILPIKVEGRRLTLLMADPTDFPLIDEISFRTGMIVKPVVAAEIRISLAIEKHYKISRQRNYIQVTRKLTKKRTSPPPVEETVAAPIMLREETPDEFDLFPDFFQEGPEGIEELAEVEPIEEIFNSETLSLCLAEARDREDILDNIASYLSHEYKRVVLFLVRDNTAHGWKASVDQQEIPAFNQTQLPLDEPSILRTVYESKSVFLGPIPRTPFNSMFLQEIGGHVPQSALLVPLLLNNRVIGIIYIDGQQEELSGKVADLQKLSTKAAMAFEILALKSKILSV